MILINLFNYIDRQVLAAVEPEVRRCLLLDVDSSDPNTMTKMGLLSSAFLFTYMLAAPLFGLMAERYSRWLLIAAGVILWSLATGASGMAGTWSMLLIMRCLVGIGEAAYGPAAPAIISDYFPVEMRGRVMAWFYAAIPVGGAMGYIVGGQFAAYDHARESWRWAFYVMMVPGLLLGLWALLKRDPKRGAADAISKPARRATFRDYLVLCRTPSYVLDCLGMTAMTFAIGALAFWMPAYLEEHAVPQILGMEAPGLFRSRNRYGRADCHAVRGHRRRLASRAALRFLFPGFGHGIARGRALLTRVPVRPLSAGAGVRILRRVLPVLQHRTEQHDPGQRDAPRRMRATAFAMNILVIHMLGDAITPPVVGAIADKWSLTHGFLVVTIFMGIGGLLWLWGARYLERDTAAAPHRLD